MRIFLIKREDKFFVGIRTEDGRKQAVFSPSDARVFLNKSSLDRALWSLDEFKIDVEIVPFDKVR